MAPRIDRLELFADYFQLYLEDDGERADPDIDWEAAVERMLAAGDGFVMIGTVRNMTVPLTVEVTQTEPAADPDDWDHVAECGLAVRSGRIVVSGCTDYRPDAARIAVEPGEYRVRVSYGGLNTLSEDGLDGQDHYRAQLWPAPLAELRVLKQRPQDGS
ncbi:hypothetical protein BN1110_04110 [bacterium YEK0313]|nr:hypothetical protein BN1110_04110 [bacterium YEK0313]